MRYRSPLALAGVLIILLIAVMGFAAFSASPVETAQTADGVVLPPTASGRIAGSVIGAQLATSVTPVPTDASEDAAAPGTEAAVEVAETTTTTEATTTTSTTAAPPTTTAAPTTTTKAPTTTTAAPTTTTAAPTTTTAAPTTTTSAAPPTTPPVWDHPPEIEQWRPLVETYWPADLVEEALAVIWCESRGNPLAVNPTSSASGLFQFLPSTWATASPAAGWGGADVFDPEPNIATAAWLYAQFTEPWQQWSCKPWS